MRRRALLLAATLAAACGDQANPTLQIVPRSAGDVDPFASAARVRARVFDSADALVAETSFSVAEGEGAFPDELPFGELRVEIEALSAGDGVLGRGASRLHELSGESIRVEVVVAAVDTFWAAGDGEGVAFATATALADGTVLVTGGMTVEGGAITGISRNGWLYDPDTAELAPIASLAQARAGHTATLLRPDAAGRRYVLVAGGLTVVNGELEASATAELYDPLSGVFAAVDPLDEARAFHTATLLLDGRVLLAGGMRPVAQRIADGPTLDGLAAEAVSGTTSLFDPAGGDFAPGPDLPAPRWAHVAVRADAGGRVVIAGGRGANGAALATADALDNGADEFESAPPLSAPRARPAAVRVEDGVILIVGGESVPGDPSSALASTDVLRETTSQAGPILSGPRSGAVATLLAGGRVLVTGGLGQDGEARGDAEVIAIGGTSRVVAGPLAVPRAFHAAASLPGDHVLLVGGVSSGSAVGTGEVYVDPRE